MQQLIDQVVEIAKDAGDAIMDIYRTDFDQYEKSDSSPLTEADLAAHKIICDGLNRISDYPILSEESEKEDVNWERRRKWNTYWLVDPLDGTKEFIKKNDEFTVNIALIKDRKSVLGVVYCPPLKRFYFAEESIGAYRKDGDDEPQKIKVATEPVDGEVWKVVGSRSHGAEALQVFCKELGKYELVSMGSSLKLCLVAEGTAHIYPRLAPTCEWDTGAAQAIVEQAGGLVLAFDLQSMEYGRKEVLLNPMFIACSNINDRWAAKLKSYE